VACLVIAPLALAGAGLGRSGTPVPRRLATGAVLVAGLSLLSVGWADSRSRAILHTVSWVEAAVIVAWCATLVRLRPEQVMRWIARLCWLLIAGAVALEAHLPGFGPPSTVNPLSGDYASYYTRLSHPWLGRSNNLATLLAVMFLPLAWWAVVYGRHRLIAALTGVAIVATLSRGVLLCLLIAVVLAAPAARRQARRLVGWLLGLAVAAGFVVAVAAFTLPNMRDYFSTRFSLANVTSRLDLLHLGSGEVTAHPLLGVGGGNGADIHNTFIQQIVYYGLLPGAVAALVIAGMPRWFFRQHTPIASVAGWSVAGVWLSFLVESSLEGTLLLPEIFLAVGLLAALVLATERNGPPPDSYTRREGKKKKKAPPPVRQRVKQPPPAPLPAGELSEGWRRALGVH
jgi:hypothetical protein